MTALCSIPFGGPTLHKAKECVCYLGCTDFYWPPGCGPAFASVLQISSQSRCGFCKKAQRVQKKAEIFTFQCALFKQILATFNNINVLILGCRDTSDTFVWPTVTIMLRVRFATLHILGTMMKMNIYLQVIQLILSSTGKTVQTSIKLGQWP